MTEALRGLAVEAAKPRVRCEGKTCSCGDYPSRMHAFRKAATPEEVIRLLDANANLSRILKVALNELTRDILGQVYSNDDV